MRTRRPKGQSCEFVAVTVPETTRHTLGFELSPADGQRNFDARVTYLLTPTGLEPVLPP